MWRSRAALALFTLGSVLLAAGVLAGIANREVVNGSRFAAHVDEIRQQAPVARQVGLAMSDAIIRADPNLTALRPLIEASAISVAGSPSFGSVVRGATRQLHEALTEPDSGAVVLRLADIGAVLAGVLQRVAPSAAAALPANLDVTLSRVGDQSIARRTIDVARRIRLLAWLLPSLAVLCLVAGVALSGQRWRALRPAGAAVIGSAMLTAATGLVGSVVASHSDVDSLRGALRAAILDQAVGWLWWPVAVLVGTGVVVRLAGSLDAGGLAPEGVFAWRDWLAVHPSSSRVRAARAGLLIVVALLIIDRPSQALGILAVIVGIGVLVVGIGEAVRAAVAAWSARSAARASRSDAAVADTASGRSRRRASRLIAGVAVVAIVALVVALGWPASRVVPALAARAEGTACNGHVELCDRPYNDVAFVATHNSMSAADEDGWYLAEQPTGLIGQLEAGVRALLIDTWYGQATTTPGVVANAPSDAAAGRAQLAADLGPAAVESALRLRNAVAGTPVGPIEPYLCHGVCEIGATKWEPVMAQVRLWLQAHPREVVSFFIEDTVSAADTATVFQQAGLLPYVAVHEVGTPWPTLGSMIDSGKRVVVLMQRHGGGTKYPWLLQGWDNAQDTIYNARTPAQFSCALNRGQAGNPLLLVNHWLNNFRSLVTDSARVNAFDVLYPRMQACRAERKQIPTYVAVNFYNLGAAFRVVDRLNGVG